MPFHKLWAGSGLKMHSFQVLELIIICFEWATPVPVTTEFPLTAQSKRMECPITSLEPITHRF